MEGSLSNKVVREEVREKQNQTAEFKEGADLADSDKKGSCEQRKEVESERRGEPAYLQDVSSSKRLRTFLVSPSFNEEIPNGMILPIPGKSFQMLW